MKEIPQKLFHIEMSHLGEQRIFPFHLYVHNPQSDSYSLFLVANSPLDQEKVEFIEFIESKGGQIAIDTKQKRTFLNHLDLTPDQIPSLTQRELSDYEKKRLEKLQKIENEKKLDEQGNEIIEVYDLKSNLSECISQDNFLAMIEKARQEIEVFPLNISHTVSLATYLAESLLIEDNMTNRIVALSYFLAKNMDMKNEQTLSDLVCAAFFCHLGYTQMELSISHTAELELSPDQKKALRKHPGYSHHLLLKSKLEISERCKNIIFQHHERYDGSGYPNQKHGEFIDILALTLGAVTHIFEYSSGKINGSKIPLTTVITRLKNKTFSAGLEFEFGDKIYENLINIITISTPENSEAA